MRVYFDNAASTPMAPEVLEYMQPLFCDLFGNPSSTHSHGRALKARLETARRTIAKHLNASPSEICFTSGGTEADNTVLMGAVHTLGVQHIVTTTTEHHAVTHTVEHLEKSDSVKVTYLSLNEQGEIDLEELRQVLEHAPKTLVCLMHGNNEIGTLHDLHAIGNICREHGAYFHSDTVQTMGHYAFDLEKLPIDFLAASAHKFYGPKGVGFLFVRKGIGLPCMIHGGSQERNLRAGTENLPGIIGMAAALDLCYGQLEEKTVHLRGIKEYMKAKLEAEIPGVTFNGCTEAEKSLPTVLNVCFPIEGDGMLLFNLDLAGISVSGGSACSSGSVQGSHVLHAIGCPVERSRNAVRFSFGRQNVREEVDYVVEKLKDIVSQPAL